MFGLTQPGQTNPLAGVWRLGSCLAAMSLKGETTFKHQRLTVDSANREPGSSLLSRGTQDAYGGQWTKRPTLDGQVLGEGSPGARLDLQSCQKAPGKNQLVQGGRHPKNLGGRKVFPNLMPGHSITSSRA